MEEIKTEKHLSEGKREKGMNFGKQEHIKKQHSPKKGGGQKYWRQK